MIRKPGFLGFSSGGKGLAVLLALVLAGAAVVGGTAWWTRSQTLEELRSEAANSLTVYSVGLEEVMDKYRAVTVMLSNRDDVRAILTQAGQEVTPALRRRAVAFADRQAFLAAADELRIIRSDGEIVGTGGPVNREHVSSGNVAHRGYFIDAMQGRLGRSIVLRDNLPGGERRSYIFGAPVRDGTRIVGVLALEVGLSAVESAWVLSPDPVTALDDSGRVLLSNRQALVAELLAAPAPLPGLPVEDPAVPRVTQEVKLVRYGLPGLSGRDWLQVDMPMPVLGWTLRILTDSAIAGRQAVQAAAIALLLSLLAGGGLLLILNRRAELVSRVRRERASSLRLERRVRDRTRALQDSNLQLAREVKEREAAEAELRQTQSELIQTAKLAVIGQMSAALSHEFNQPLGAIRSYAENAGKFLDMDKPEEARENMRLVAQVVERMATLSRHLKSFARRPGGSRSPVKLGPILDEVVMLLSPRMKKEGVELRILGSDEVDYVVLGDRVHLSQVLVNIVANAIDAMAAAEQKVIRLSCALSTDGAAVVISIDDSGPGIGQEILENIFDPFFTTKEVGEGLGIGLSIAYNIIRDLGGRLEVENLPKGGARFTLTLPLAERDRERNAAE